jgi:hypothetical protein
MDGKAEVSSGRVALLRWLILPFAAVCCPILALAAWATASFVAIEAVNVAHDGWFNKYFNPAFGFGLFGFIYSQTVLFVAPTHKKRTAAIMSILLGLVALAAVLQIWVENSRPPLDTWVTSLMYLFMVVTAAAVVVDPGWQSRAARSIATHDKL